MKVQPVKENDQEQLPLKPKRQQENPNNDIRAGQIKIDFYTDPLCCWSWAFEQHWKKLLQTYHDRISYRYIMCGMIPDWKSYNDPLNSVSKPIQMGPVWMHASEVTHVKMHYSIWHERPPSSSFPACIAVKTAGLQSKAAEDKYLFNVRRALMEDGSDISQPQVLLSIARQVQDAGFDFEQFSKDWKAGNGKESFRSDLQTARFHNIGRFPTLTLQNSKGKGVIIIGYRPYEILHQAFLKVTESEIH
jgi:predicted DsbA family dithiol-disulfide isomerase